MVKKKQSLYKKNSKEPPSLFKDDKLKKVDAPLVVQDADIELSGRNSFLLCEPSHDSHQALKPRGYSLKNKSDR